MGKIALRVRASLTHGMTVVTPRNATMFCVVNFFAFCAGTPQAFAAPVQGQGSWETSLLARDVNADGTVDAYYDVDLKITWLADAFADTHLPTPAGRPLRSPTEGHEWVTQVNLFGITGWRLPKASNPLEPMGPTRRCASAYPGYCGYNADTNLSELAHMYYVTLGNKASISLGGVAQPVSGLTNTGPFQQLLPVDYWTNTQSNGPGTFVWAFNMNDGYQFLEEWVTGQYGGGAWAVHDGDIAAVPEPSVGGLAIAGAIAIAGATMRRRHGARN